MKHILLHGNPQFRLGLLKCSQGITEAKSRSSRAGFSVLWGNRTVKEEEWGQVILNVMNCSKSRSKETWVDS